MDGSDDRDPLEGLEDRLQSHAKAFESLLALTPAQDYYGSQIVDGKDPSEQWSRKKQTKEQKRAAKKAKLDPANQKSALDVMREREAEAMKKKRKREGDDGGDDGDGDEAEAEPAQPTKRKKGEEDADAAEAKRRAKAERRKEKRQQKKEKLEHRKEKAEAKKAARQDGDLAEAQAKNQNPAEEPVEEDNDDEDEPGAADKDADLQGVDFSGLAEPDVVEGVDEADEAASEGSSAPSTPALDSPAFDVSTNHSTASSSSSIIPPEEEDGSIKAPPKTKKAPLSKPIVDTKAASALPTQQSSSKSTDPPSGIAFPKIQLPDIDHDELQARVRKRIEELRAARKADGPEGKPARSRQELLEQRRKKGEQRKAAKKAQRQKQKEDEAQHREAQLRGSGSPLSADIFSPRSPRPQENNYSFSRLAFDDGTSADPSMTSLRDPKKTKGPSDPRTALQAAQNKQSRLAGYDPAKRAEIGEKDMWLHARQRAQGERVKDDTNLLKKALKRKEKQKNKSEKQWQEREQAVVKGREMKQKKRETNLQKRKDEKGSGGGGKKKGKGGKGAAAGGGGKKKGRPGFEGRFKA